MGDYCGVKGVCTSYSPKPASKSNADRLAICNDLVDSTNKGCTFLLGFTTCVARTCGNNYFANNQSDCIEWLSDC